MLSALIDNLNDMAMTRSSGLLEKLLRTDDDDTIFDPNTEGCKASLNHPVLSGHNRLARVSLV